MTHAGLSLPFFLLCSTHSAGGKHSNHKLGGPTWTAKVMPTRASNLVQQEEQISRSEPSNTTAL